jgi:dipeptidyl aminopeptidase/acylaminoacyl peptidase
VVIAHGGPVSATSAALGLGDMALMAAAYWTSRGYAVIDVNYRGSTGYGRPYREALHGRWGVLDVDDCVDAATYLIDRGAADPERVVVRGWSAGGYTTLMGLALRDFFAAGTAYFPVADLAAVHNSMHKYEAGYDHLLIGDWERDQERYRQRSPVNHVAGITAPLLVVQGLDDPVCPAPQTERPVTELRALGRDVDYVSFAGEGHGFHRAASIITSLETEAALYARVFGTGPAAAR